MQLTWTMEDGRFKATWMGLTIFVYTPLHIKAFRDARAEEFGNGLMAVVRRELDAELESEKSLARIEHAGDTKFQYHLASGDVFECNNTPYTDWPADVQQALGKGGFVWENNPWFQVITDEESEYEPTFALQKAVEGALRIAHSKDILQRVQALQAQDACPDGCTDLTRSLGECTWNTIQKANLLVAHDPQAVQYLEEDQDKRFLQACFVEVDGGRLYVKEAGRLKAALRSPQFHVAYQQGWTGAPPAAVGRP